MTTPQQPDAPLIVSPEDKRFWLERRQALLIEIAAIERRLGLARSVTPRHERERMAFERRRGGEGEG